MTVTIGTSGTARSAYGRNAARYSAYANGNPRDALYDFEVPRDRRYTDTDRLTWRQIRYELDVASPPSGNEPVRILDAGCGDGVWMVRMADYLEGKNQPYEIIGLDITPELLETAEQLRDDYNCKRGRPLNIVFEEGNLEEPLPFAENQFDFSLTGFTVLNHLCKERLPGAVGELLRVTRGHHMTLLKPPGGEQSAYICDMSDVQECRLDGDCTIVIDCNGDEHSLIARPISALEFREIVASQGGHVIDMFGIDIFTSMILGRPRAASGKWLPGEESVAMEYLARLDEAHCRDPEILNWANHLCAVVKRCR